MADEQQVEPIEVVVDETPESDPIMDALTDTEDQPEAEGKVEEEVVETEDTDEETPAEEEQPAEEDEVDPEEQRKEEARRRYEERQAAIAERKSRVEAKTKDYVEEAETDTEQRLRNIEVQEYNRMIEHTEQTLINEYDRAIANPNLQIFNPDSPEYSPEAWNYAIKNYEAANIIVDANGERVGLKGSLFEHLTETAGLLKGAIKTGAVQQVRATRSMKSNADTKPAAQPKETTKDDILEILKSD